MMKKLLLFVGATTTLVASTLTTHANVPPADTSYMGDVIEVHGLPSGNGKYWRWSSDSNTLGWLKRNPDGSSFQLMATFNGPIGLSKSLSSLVLHDTKTGSKQTLLPNTSNTGWVLSWQDSNFNIVNRTSSGLHYGHRGIPYPTVVRERVGVTETPWYRVTTQLTAGAKAPDSQGNGSSLGTYRVSVSSGENLKPGLNLTVDIDDAQGKTVFTAPMSLKVAPETKEATQDIVLSGPLATLATGIYTLNVELRGTKGEFLGGVTTLMDIKSVSQQLGSTITGGNAASASITLNASIPISARPSALFRLEAMARSEFNLISNASRGILYQNLSKHGHRHNISVGEAITSRSLFNPVSGNSTGVDMSSVLNSTQADLFTVLRNQKYTTSTTAGRKVISTPDGLLVINYTWGWKPVNNAVNNIPY
jgi:hypothetical protein